MTKSVANYARKIKEVSERMIYEEERIRKKGWKGYIPDIAEQSTLAITTAASLAEADKVFLKPAYHLSGVISLSLRMLLGKHNEASVSDRIRKTFSDPRFHEYGLDNVFYNYRDDFGYKWGSRREKYGVLALAVAGSLTFPPVGYAALANILRTHRQNSLVAKRIERAFKIADKVNDALQSKANTQKDIEDWLTLLETYPKPQFFIRKQQSLRWWTMFQDSNQT